VQLSLSQHIPPPSYPERFADAQRQRLLGTGAKAHRRSHTRYDTAGRLTSIERKPDAATPSGNSAERTLYQLDATGNRTREEQQSWDGGAWITEATTDYVFNTRCHLDRTIQAPGTPEEAITEYRYDCNGNLSQLWDANHDPMADPPTQTYAYL
jgi:hypothetical protein